jgi:hypothetical protein
MARSVRSRPKGGGRKRRRTSSAAKPRASTPWPTIEEFLDSEEGTISLGAINHSSLGYTAVASDEHNMLVALVRNRGETLHQLLDRLEQALGPAIEDHIYVDEINNP